MIGAGSAGAGAPNAAGKVGSRSLASAGVIVVNPTVSRLRDPERRQRVLATASRAVEARTGVEPVVIEADDPLVMRDRLAIALDDDPALVSVVGGDGTVRDVAAVLGDRPVALAIVPAGTANLFAAALRIPLEPERAARAIEGSRARHVDLGRIRHAAAGGDDIVDQMFMVGAGIGFDARVMAGTRRSSKRRLGRYAYFTTAARELARAAPIPLRVSAEGSELDLEAFEVLVANSGELIPGLLRPALRVDPADGRLDVFIVAGGGRAAAVRGAIEAIGRRRLGRSGSGCSYRLRVRSIRVEAGSHEPVEVDGDVAGSGWFEASCVPKALTVLVPERGHSPAVDARRLAATRRR